MSPRKLGVPEVVAVREDQGQPPKIIPHQFKLHIQHSQHRLVLFCLTISSTNGASPLKTTTFYLYITAYSLDLLD
ncbi:hypothetical protein LY78DRAFT_368232 [Colletotrichum sublineola]|nr:hypothetical protein LY78DRAFT_368232 [Colletotrichum sublineola]